MRTTRLEAFSDGVLAIIITVMVLELRVPAGHDWSALGDSATGFSTYALSFLYIGIYWNNHHHLFQVVETVTGSVLWANLHLLFWLSLLPFATAWMDESAFAVVPTVLYGVDLLLAALAFYGIELAVSAGSSGERLRAALGRDLKGKLSPLMYLAGITLAFVHTWLAVLVFVAAAVVWLVPDSRVERFLRDEARARETA